MKQSIYIVMTAFLLLSSCGGSKKSENEEHQHEASAPNIVKLTDAQVKVSGVTTGTAVIRSISNLLKVNGEITSLPQNTASVSMPMGGRISRINVIQGGRVQRGQILAVVENSDFIDVQQNYLEAKSKLEYTQADYARQRELVKNDAASKKNLQLVASEYKTLKVQIGSLAEKLRLLGINPSRLSVGSIRRSLPIVAPISGYIKSVNVSIGKTVSDADVLFEIVNLDKLFIKLTIFEKDIASVSKGQHIDFFINDETEVHRAVVYQTSKAIDEDKTYKVFAAIESRCENVLPGMYVNARLQSRAHEVWAVPDDAVVSFEGKDYLFVFDRRAKEGGTMMSSYRLVQVTRGASDDGFTAVTFPKDFDVRHERIVFEGSYSLLSTMKNEGEMSC
jgi:cobalt-zinc-cadmium efflux system membrane fusion protein